MGPCPANEGLRARGSYFWRPPVLRGCAGQAIDGFLAWQRDTGNAPPELPLLVEAVASGRHMPEGAARELIAALERDA